MRLRIRSSEDFWAGVMFAGFGLVAIIVARDYPMGSAMRMGPGYFPTYLGALLMLIGGVIVARATVVDGEGVGRWGWRPLLMLGAALLAYGIFMDTFEIGFIPSLIGVVVISSFAGREFRPFELGLLTLILVAGAVALFIYGLGLPYPLLWWR